MPKPRLIYGFHGIHAVLRHHPERLIRVYYDQHRLARNDRRMVQLIEALQDQGISITAVENSRLDHMMGTVSHQGVVAETRAEVRPNLSTFLAELTQHVKNPIVMILDSVTDPHNVGACFRVADAFGVAAIIAPKDRSAGLTPTVVKSASGATETVPFFAVTNLARTIDQLKSAGFWLYGTDSAESGAIPIAQNDLTSPMAWVFGSEGKGMRLLTRQHCDYLVTIPMLGTVESLNISVAAGICLYETQRQRSKSLNQPIEVK